MADFQFDILGILCGLLNGSARFFLFKHQLEDQRKASGRAKRVYRDDLAFRIFDPQLLGGNATGIIGVADTRRKAQIEHICAGLQHFTESGRKSFRRDSGRFGHTFFAHFLIKFGHGLGTVFEFFFRIVKAIGKALAGHAPFFEQFLGKIAPGVGEDRVICRHDNSP